MEPAAVRLAAAWASALCIVVWFWLASGRHGAAARATTTPVRHSAEDVEWEFFYDAWEAT